MRIQITPRLRLQHLAFAVHLLACAMACQAAYSQSPAGRYPLTPAAILAAVKDAGMTIAPGAIELPGTLSAAVPAPVLRVQGAELLPNGRVRLRLACERLSECLPFFATADLGPAHDALSQMETLQSSSSPKERVQPLQRPVLAAGQRAVLLLEDRHMRIELPVIAIDTGAPGTEVRVSSLDRKTIFHGVVADDRTVRGALP